MTSFPQGSGSFASSFPFYGNNKIFGHVVGHSYDIATDIYHLNFMGETISMAAQVLLNDPNQAVSWCQSVYAAQQAGAQRSGRLKG